MKLNILLSVIQLSTQFLTSHGEQTSIIAALLDLVLNPGNVATFECGATTDMRTTVVYNCLRDGVLIDEADPLVVIEDGALTILNVSSEDTATYTCVAQNGIDNDTASAKLEVRAPPGAPYNVIITTCYAHRAGVEWSFDKTQEKVSPLLGFIVEYNTSFTPSEWVVGVRTSPDSRSVRIQLSLWTTYSFRVKAFNEIGTGEPGDTSPAKCRTPQGRPDRHPRNVRTVGNKTNFLVVEWETMPPIEHNAPDFSYLISVKEKDTDIFMNFVMDDYTVGRKEIYTGTTYRPYMIQVKAQNRVGHSFIQAQTITGYSGEAVPTVAPTNFELDKKKNVTSTSARFRWDPVNTSSDVIRGEYKGYKIRHWKRNQKEASLREVFIPDSTDANSNQRLRRTGNKVWAEVHTLPPYSYIEADVVVVNNYFSSEGSNILRFSTPEGVPSSVEYVNITYRGSEDIELEWGQPREPNGIVTGYQVGYRKVQGPGFGDLEISETVGKRRMSLGGLSPDTAYRVYVWGMTGVGRGEEVFTDIRTAEKTSALPGAPYNVTITTCYANRAGVEWSFDKTQEKVSPLLGFIVEYNTSFTPSEWVVGVKTSPDSRSVRIQLSLWATYSFRVKAFNEIGTGEPGDTSPAKCRTPQGRPDRHPRNVRTVGNKTNVLVIEWETMPPIEHNAPDFSYLISVKEKDTDVFMNFVMDDYTVGRKEIYTGTTYRPYMIQVKAQNRVGHPFIQAQTITGYSGEAAPTVVPTNFELASEKNVTATTARFQWDPTSTSTEVIRGEYRGYKIRHWKRNEKEASLREVFIPDSTDAGNKQRLRRTGNKVWAEVHNLPPYSHIDADVVVVNTYFSSEGSNILRFSTPEGVPSSVEFLNITDQGSEDIEMEWGHPREPNGIVIGYQVGYRKVQGPEFGDLEISEIVPDRRMRLKGLTPDTTYRVYVWGMTRVGRGEEVFTDICTAEKTSETVEIYSGPRDLELIQGDEAEFTCAARAGPQKTVEYTWLCNGVHIEEGNPQVKIEEGSLTILNITSRDTANYTCVAYSGINNATATATLQVGALPGAPYNVTITTCYANRAGVEWSFDKTQEKVSPLLGFIVEYNTSFTPSEWVVGVKTSPDSRSVRIQLSLWATYSFRVKAFNEIGTGEPGYTSPAKCRTPQGRPDRHPRNVRTIGNKTKFLVVEWETMPPIEHNAPDFSYLISVKEKDTDVFMNFVVDDYTVGRKEIYTGTTYRPYMIQVKAQNRVGRPFIQAQTITGYSGEAAPTVVPTNFELDTEMVLTPTSARFRWNPVSTSTEVIRGEYRGYKIRHWKRNQKEASLHEVFISDSTDANSNQRLKRTGNKVWAEVHNLPPYSYIEADVVVVNNYFSSEGSNILRFSTPEGVPSSVEYVNITYRGSEDIELEWGQPREPNGIVIGYQVGYRKVQGPEFGDLEISEIVPDRRTCLRGLTPDTAYRVYLWGMTRVGRGEEIFTDIRTAEETSGPVIENVAPTLTTVNVTWIDPAAGRLKDQANYYLEYRKLGTASWGRVTEERKNLWQEIKGLEVGTSYQVRVGTTAGQADNPSCRKIYSDTRKFRTISEAFLLLTQGKSIKRVDIASTSTSLVQFTKKKLKIRSPASLTFDVRKNTVFFSERRTKSINMATLEGLRFHSAVRIYQDSNSTIFGIAYDWVHKALYWTDGRRKSIRVMTLTREHRKYITTVVDGLGKPRAIALDIQQRYLYWTDRKRPAMIGRCGMDGTNGSIIISSDITWPEGLTIDYAERRLYWTDAKRDRVSSCDMDGGDRKVVVRMPGPPDERMLAITIFQDFLYWNDLTSSTLRKVNQRTRRDVEVINTGRGTPYDVKVFHTDRQPEASNACGDNNGGCSHLCLPSPHQTSQSTNFLCKCPDDRHYQLSSDDRTCITDDL